MFKKVIETSGSPNVHITECLGDLVVKGIDGSLVELRVRGVEGDLSLSQEEDSLTFTTYADCILSCPHSTTLTVDAVRGDLKIRGLAGPLSVDTVNGDVRIQDAGPVKIGHIFGELRAQEIAGDLEAQTLRGDARIASVAGSLSLDEVSGDLRAEGIMGDLVTTVGADVRLEPPFLPGTVYKVQAGSDLRVNIPKDASLRLSLLAGGRVRSRVEDLVLAEVEGRTEALIGAGEATIEAEVGGHVYLREVEAATAPEGEFDFGFAGDLEDLGAVIELRISEAMSDMETRLQESLGRIDSDAVRLRVEQATERARRAASRAAEAARHEVEVERRRAEREAERARLRKERAERRWKRVSGRRPAPPKPQVSDEERMRVLRMVEEGKIAPEQAADLLAALEGR
jgi:hypothetical protein